MKKLSVFAGMSILLVFGSCASYDVKDAVATIVFNDSVPLEKSSWIGFSTYLGTVTAYNGISVSDWKTEFGNMIQIPAGDTLIELDVDHTTYGYNSSTRYIAKNMMFRFNFQPRKQYLIFWGTHVEGDGWFDPVSYGVKIYAWDFGEKISNKYLEDDDPNNLGFVPFLIQPVFR
jgi:hypothetical protein